MPDESTPKSTQPLERRLATILCADVAVMFARSPQGLSVSGASRGIFRGCPRPITQVIYETCDVPEGNYFRVEKGA